MLQQEIELRRELIKTRDMYKETGASPAKIKAVSDLIKQYSKELPKPETEKVSLDWLVNDFLR